MDEKKDELGYLAVAVVGVLVGAGVLWLTSWYGVLFMLLTMLIFELHDLWAHD